MSPSLLRRLTPAESPYVRRNPVDKKARGVAETIVEAVRADGETALRKYAEQFGELKPGAQLVFTRDVELKAAYDAISQAERDCLERTAERIRVFALAQKSALQEVPPLSLPLYRRLHHACGRTCITTSSSISSNTKIKYLKVWV